VAALAERGDAVNDRVHMILLKKAEIEVPRKSHFRVESVVSTGACHSKG
jgi:hypothetical protein